MHQGHEPTQQMRFIGLGRERGLSGLGVEGSLSWWGVSLVWCGEAWLGRTEYDRWTQQILPCKSRCGWEGYPQVGYLCILYSDQRKQELATRCWDLPAGQIGGSPVSFLSPLSICLSSQTCPG